MTIRYWKNKCTGVTTFLWSADCLAQGFSSPRVVRRSGLVRIGEVVSLNEMVPGETAVESELNGKRSCDILPLSLKQVFEAIGLGPTDQRLWREVERADEKDPSPQRPSPARGEGGKEDGRP